MTQVSSKGKKTKGTHWLAVWDMYGLESLFNLSAHLKELESYEKDLMWNTLSEKTTLNKKPTLPLNMILLRARVNSHRHYEIYTFTSSKVLKEKDIRHWFASTPQDAANWVRENGYKVLSNRISSRQVIV